MLNDDDVKNQFSLYWTALTYIGIRWVQPFIQAYMYKPFFSTWFVLIPFLIIAFLVDEGLTIRKHVIMNQTIMSESKK